MRITYFSKELMNPKRYFPHESKCVLLLFLHAYVVIVVKLVFLVVSLIKEHIWKEVLLQIKIIFLQLTFQKCDDGFI